MSWAWHAPCQINLDSRANQLQFTSKLSLITDQVPTWCVQGSYLDILNWHNYSLEIGRDQYISLYLAYIVVQSQRRDDDTRLKWIRKLNWGNPLGKPYASNLRVANLLYPKSGLGTIRLTISCLLLLNVALAMAPDRIV